MQHVIRFLYLALTAAAVAGCSPAEEQQARDAGQEAARETRAAGAEATRETQQAGGTVARESREAGSEVARETREAGKTVATEAREAGRTVAAGTRELVGDVTREAKDAALAGKVQAAMKLRQGLDTKRIEVKANGQTGNVLLEGSVPNMEQRKLAEEVARATDGVKGVENQLAVPPAAGSSGG